MKNFFLIISGILLSTSLFAQSQAKIVSDKITSIKTYEQSLSKGIDDKYIIEELSYDEAGRVIERKELNSKGDIKLWKKFKFDQSGNLIEEIVFDVEGKLEKREVSYYTNNLRTHKEYFDSKGRLYKKKPMHTNTGNNINQLLTNFAPINLEQMDAVSFLNRTDTKYVFHRDRLESLLLRLQEQFSMLIIKGSGVQHYTTVYMDTPMFEMYHQHHNGLRDRFKIRTRQYTNSKLFFLELKKKNNKGVTAKKREKTSSVDLESQKDSFFEEKTPYTKSDVAETLKNSFSRITFVNEKTPERITLDFALSYINLKNEKHLEIPNACILEIKRNQNAKNRVLDQILKDLEIYPTKFSKYCMGMSLLEPNLKTNRFKAGLHILRKKEIIN